MTPTRIELINLRENRKLTREQIAEHYDVSLTTVRRWIKELNVPRPSKQVKYERFPGMTRTGEIVAEPDDGFTLLDKAKTLLGDRLIEKRGKGYFLDGRPCNVYKILEAAGVSKQ